MNKRIDRQMDKIDFIGRRPTNFERPRGEISYTIINSSSQKISVLIAQSMPANTIQCFCFHLMILFFILSPFKNFIQLLFCHLKILIFYPITEDLWNNNIFNNVFDSIIINSFCKFSSKGKGPNLELIGLHPELIFICNQVAMGLTLKMV